MQTSHSHQLCVGCRAVRCSLSGVPHQRSTDRNEAGSRNAHVYAIGRVCDPTGESSESIPKATHEHHTQEPVSPKNAQPDARKRTSLLKAGQRAGSHLVEIAASHVDGARNDSRHQKTPQQSTDAIQCGSTKTRLETRAANRRRSRVSHAHRVTTPFFVIRRAASEFFYGQTLSWTRNSPFTRIDLHRFANRTGEQTHAEYRRRLAFLFGCAQSIGRRNHNTCHDTSITFSGVAFFDSGSSADSSARRFDVDAENSETNGG